MSRLLAIYLFLIFPVFFLLRPFQNEQQHPSRAIPDSFDILHYTINLTIPDISSGKIIGVTDIQIKSLKDSLNRITLQLKSLKTDSVWIDEEPVSRYKAEGEHIFIYPDDPLSNGTTSVITVFYHGSPIRDPSWGGVYFTPVSAFTMGVCMSFTPPSGGRLWYPCIDDFREKASYDYFITISDTLEVACPGLPEEVIPTRDHMHTVHWSMDLPISSYLSSFAVSDYHIFIDTLNGISGQIPAYYFIPAPKDNASVKTFSNVSEYLKVFERLFGPYIWPKIGYVGVPFPGGAMEHATCIFIPNRIIDGSIHGEDLLVHEFAHSWFGNLVTCSTPQDMWLNEGFASYAVALYKEQTDGVKAYQDYIRHLHRRVLLQTHLADQGYYPVSGVPPEHTYGSTVYDKGADMIHNLRNFLGDNYFFESLRIYLKTFAFGNASTQNLEKIISGISHKQVNDFFNTWIYTPGFPHFTANLDSIEPHHNNYLAYLTLSQQKIGREDYSYSVPIEVSLIDLAGNEDMQTVFFSGEKEHLTLQTDILPVLVILDKNEKVNDATITEPKLITQPGTYDFSECSFSMNVEINSDSVYFRTVLHAVSPDSSMMPLLTNSVANVFWSLESIIPDTFSANGHFTIYDSQIIDKELKCTTGSEKHLILLYKPLYRGSWQKKNARFSFEKNAIVVSFSDLLPGHYCVVYK